MMDFQVMYELETILKQRKAQMPEESYVVGLYKSGMVKILDKLGEEVAELIVAVNCDSDDRVINEAADSYFHFLLALAFVGLDFEKLPLTREDDYKLAQTELCAQTGKQLGQSICAIANHEKIKQQDLVQDVAMLFMSIGSLLFSRQINFAKVEEELRRRMT